MTSKNPIAVWDFTAKADDISMEEIKEFLKKHCKKWCFQKEQGKTSDYIHFQGRCSFSEKTRKPPKPVKSFSWRPTSCTNSDNVDYVSKDDTRIEGPWKHNDPEVYIPRQYRGIMDRLYPWQKKVIDDRNDFNDRYIKYIYDATGNNGKSTIASLCELNYNCIDVPPINDAKELMQYVCNECMDNNNRRPPIIFVDLPRAFDKSTLNGIFSACEQIKKGKLYDCRFHAKKYWIDSPQIYVFSNEPPNTDYLSKDRWQIYTITKEKTLDNYYNIDNNNVSFEGVETVILPQKKLKKKL